MSLAIFSFKKTIPIDQNKIKKIILEVLKRESVQQSGAINICFTSDRQIRLLNKRYCGKDLKTDVLAFDLGSEKGRIFGDIFISWDTAITNSKIFKTTPLGEAYLYVIHGLLHILGYDDHGAKERALMRSKEQEYLVKSKLKRQKSKPQVKSF